MIQIGQKQAGLDTPLEHLMACHRRIEDRLTVLESAADHLAEHPAQALDAIAACFRFLDSSGALHTADEEHSLFPRLRPLLSLEELAYVDSLEDEHKNAEAVYTTLKVVAATLANGSGADVANYRALAAQLSRLYRDHIQSEDEVLTRLARRSLANSDLEAISREMRERRQSL